MGPEGCRFLLLPLWRFLTAALGLLVCLFRLGKLSLLLLLKLRCPEALVLEGVAVVVAAVAELRKVKRRPKLLLLRLRRNLRRLRKRLLFPPSCNQARRKSRAVSCRARLATSIFGTPRPTSRVAAAAQERAQKRARFVSLLLRDR